MNIVNKIKQLSNLNNLTAEDIGDKLNCTWRTVITIAQENDIEIETKRYRSKDGPKTRIVTRSRG